MILREIAKNMYQFISPSTKKWIGDYKDWGDVARECRGYGESSIIQKILEA